MGRIVEQLRTQSGFSAKDVAEYLGVDEQQYAVYEENVNMVPVDALEKLADLYHVEEYDILTGTARSRTYTESPRKELELIPFFRMVSAYLKIERLLKECEDEHK